MLWFFKDGSIHFVVSLPMFSGALLGELQDTVPTKGCLVVIHLSHVGTFGGVDV